MSEVIRYDIDNPDHLRLSDNGDLVRHEDYQTLRDERDRIRAALEVAGDDICSEYCGAGPCHKKCLAVKAALTPATGDTP